ncbi:TonB-dependent receptor [Sphingomonas crocodyli]|uniref:TonB-dependent receptor n=1 Tax=Sphingomonas crocodyli TaxID=1979270 RepID=A0A437LWR4_9SPHN|nr:TonB-dependent receptor [Sphingomonas crocodyli]RVT89841.1 TonB-dependent receptor [Sphingomonas crocodyli]
MSRSSSFKASSSPAFLALGCVGLIASAPGYAQDAKPANKDLGSFEVTDTAIDEVKVDRVESPKATRPLVDTPQTITVIGKTTIQQQNLLTLRDVLSTVPGITFGAGEGGFGYGDRIILRGQDAKNDVTTDGVRSQAFGNRNEVYNIEQVEVTNGANSVVNGGGSVAGTINLVTKRPLAEDQTVISAGVGTDNYYRATVDANARVSDFIAIRLNAVYHENDVPGRKVEDYKRWGVAPAITFGIDSPTSFTLQGEYLDDKAMPQYGLRYYANLGGFLPEFDREGYYGFANLDKQNSKTKSVQGIFSHEFSDKVKIRNLSRFEHIRQDTVTSQPNGTFCLASTGLQPQAPFIGGTAAACGAAVPPGFYLPTGGRGVQRFITNETTYNQTDLTAEVDTGGIKHSIVLGASILLQDYAQTQGNLPRNPDGSTPAFPLVSISNPGTVVQGPSGGGRVYGNNTYNGPINFILGSRNRGEQNAYAVYLFDTIAFTDWFELNGGMRYEKNKGFNRTISYSTSGATIGQVSGTTGPFSNNDNLFSYRVGAVFKPTPNTSLYFAYGNSKLPSQTSVDGSCATNNCNVKPETTKNYEIGVKADLFDKKLLLTASLFRNDRDSIRIASNDPTQTDQRLDGNQRVEGVSLGASGNITPNWTISANYMYLKSDIKQGVSDVCLANPGVTNAVATCAGVNNAAFPDPTRGYSLTNTPKHSGSLFTTYRFDFGLEIGYGLTHQGKFLLNQPTLAQLIANTYVAYNVPSYTIHRAMASYAFTDNLKAQVNVQNFTNKKYVTTVRNAVAGSWAQPGVGRSAVFSLNYAF